MLSDPLEFGRLRNRILFVTAVAWLCLLAGSVFSGMEAGMAAAHQSHSGHAVPAGMLRIDPRASSAIGWLFMTLAMMAPTLIAPLWYIHVRNFSGRRLRASALFGFAYVAVWMIVGALFLALYPRLNISETQSFWPAAILAIIALVWQTSPTKQRCLNACHAHRSFAAFGTSADVDALRFGISHALWCVGACWPLMLFPMLLPRGHMAAMAVVSILVFAERLENPATPTWRFRGLGKATRIVVAQTRPYWQKLVSVS